MKKISVLFASVLSFYCTKAQTAIPETGISGLYELMVGTLDASVQVKYFAEFGFRVTDSAVFTKEQALKLYGVPSALKTYRLQNGEMDSHGLLRLLQWEKPLGYGVGYGEPETVGSRMAVMKTTDIIRIYDVFKMLRESRQEKWLPTEPYFDDPLRINANTALDFYKRPVGVRENAVYGDGFTHVFFQRYGYTIPGYGTINPNAPLKTSEFTHHDFFIKVDSMEQLQYLQTALGLKREKTPEIDGDWLKGPREVFIMPNGYSHWYVGYVSPNNICGKLKFFMPRGVKPDQSAHQRPGEMGITLHSFYTAKLQMVYSLVKQHNLKPTDVQRNEFGENCFVFKGAEGSSWQIIEKMETKNKPVTKLEIVRTND
jgi:hypothetical protein